MSRVYDSPNQAIYDRLTAIHAEAVQTNNLLNLILETLRMYLPVDHGRTRTREEQHGKRG